MRHPFPGPGLAIRVLCGDEPYIEKDFSETQVLVKIIVEFDNMLQKVNIGRIEKTLGRFIGIIFIRAFPCFSNTRY